MAEPRPNGSANGGSETNGLEARSTVLVVEDNADTNRFICKILGSRYNVVSAFDGKQGLEKAVAVNPMLIIADVVMPGMSGEAMVAAMRQRPELTGVPILLLSGLVDEELKVKMLEEGAQDFVAKPFSAKDLLVRANNLITLKKFQDRYRTLFESMDEGFCTIEVLFDEHQKPIDYRFLELNTAFERQTGLMDAPGKRMRELAPTHEQHWFDIYGRIALTGEARRFENHAEALDRWFEVYAFRVGPPENHQVAIFFKDVTVRKTFEINLAEAQRQLATANEELAKTNEDLEDRVQKRTASLREANAQLEEFSYTISHDMRAPLRAMLAYSNVLLEDCGDLMASKPDALGYVERIAENARRLDKMVLDVLAFTKVARDEVRLERVHTDKLVRGLLVNDPALQAPRADVKIEPLADVMGHEAPLTQALANLLTNSVKFAVPGTTPKVRVWSEKRGGDVRLWVEDNGIGVDPKYQHRLFQMFERIHPDQNYEGTGVGLAIVRKAAERMKGSVGVESDGKNGSRFWLQLRGAEEAV